MNAPLIDSIGWTLLHFVWQGAVIGLASAVALAALRRAGPGARYLVACAGLLTCLLWPAAELTLRLSAGSEAVPLMRFTDAMLVNTVNGASGGLLALLQASLPLIVGFWAVCAAVLALRMALGLAWIGHTAARQRTDAHWQACASGIAAAFKVTRPVRLYVVERLASPLTVGWWRPVVLLPAALVSGMPPELLTALLAHEMAHIKRYDYLVNLGQNVIETVLFYHPAVWWLSGRVRDEREQIADDLAARHTGQPRQLAQALSELERLQFAGSQLTVAASGGALLTRVRRLLQPDTQARSWKAGLPLLVCALACAGMYAHAAARVPALERLIVDHTAVADFSSCAKPRYPVSAIAENRTGTVTLGFEIGPDGRVAESRVAASSGHADLDAAARSAIALCKFVPAVRAGQPVRSVMKMEYVWVLE
ncbi:M56 family metallopeptidase [Massilia sp. CF038]|uniref:M56 family metallopeptidase n=1 Tax=Massilia sp. CF038 TaxID=1881045 RepID=UPI000923F977|nr:M56 family metallopeptidase [Massilia sp. CF038]SHG68713.1 D-alanyl-D-alanine endopeptidase (penicillin-binding protein 7) [Massilia sp. CF038]